MRRIPGDSRPIGVFDSGVGGLTVLDAIHRLLPVEDLIYLGDTARVPYGTKSPQSVERYAVQAAEKLVRHGIKALVIACNTASAVALTALRQRWPGLSVLGVIEPGARAGASATRSGHVGVIATEGTVAGGAYRKALGSIEPSIQVYERPCSLFVAIAEEGWTEGELLERVLARDLEPLVEQSAGRLDTLVLGCTHFPILKGAIGRVVGGSVTLVDSAESLATELRSSLDRQGGCHPDSGRVGEIRFLVTDGVDRFVRVGSRFFTGRLSADNVELVDI